MLGRNLVRATTRAALASGRRNVAETAQRGSLGNVEPEKGPASKGSPWMIPAVLFAGWMLYEYNRRKSANALDKAADVPDKLARKSGDELPVLYGAVKSKKEDDPSYAADIGVAGGNIPGEPT